jgi:26S proteasome regulatory subunit T4
MLFSTIDYEAIVKLSDGFNGADLRNVCTEAGMFAIRDDRDYIHQDDLNKAVRKLQVRPRFPISCLPLYLFY